MGPDTVRSGVDVRGLARAEGDPINCEGSVAAHAERIGGICALLVGLLMVEIVTVIGCDEAVVVVVVVVVAVAVVIVEEALTA